METGTGKTYVGVRAMYELHQKYGLFKFIIVVPSPAIKEGWKNFIIADYAKQHFSQYYENVQINLNVINAGDFKAKKGRNNMPAHLCDFIEGSRLNNNTIEVLLINAGMLSSSSMTKEYDQTLLSGWTKPIDALQATRPIVLIDEPHRFPREKANYKSIKSLNAQMIVRLGATFPDVKIGSGRKAQLVKDYYRKQPQYNLNAVNSFNDGLVKAIDIYYPNISESQAKDTWTVDNFLGSGKDQELILRNGSTRYSYRVGDDIGFDGSITYAGSKKLSNELELEKGMTLLAATMTNSYQEMIIRDAIDKHFEAEVYNFMRENDHQAKVKTLSLFFIDSIASYREEDGWLKSIFERLLANKLRSLINEFSLKRLPREKEYLDFLRATQKNLTTDVHAGYFGEDRGSGDEAIQAEVDDILKNKEKLLSFKDEKGNWNTRRFLFSKWTLREGWDNPNVFVIAKLRTSGSENSKIQEVGRGLRLPVDENGHRLQQDELPSRLRFLIGYDEKEFAKKLVEQVNDDADIKLNEDKLTNETIKLILDNTPNLEEEQLLDDLYEQGIIKITKDFKEGGFEKLLELYPVLKETRVKPGTITTGGPKTKQRIKLNKENWNKMRDLWKQFSNRYMLKFERLPEDTMLLLLEDIMKKEDIFVLKYPEYTKQVVDYDDENNQMLVREQKADYEGRKAQEGMIYGEFLARLAKETRIKISLLHRALASALKNNYHNDTKLLNEDTLRNIVREFKERFNKSYAQKFEYLPLDFQASTSVFDVAKDDFKDDILADVIGVNVDNNAVMEPDRTLYELPPLRFDSINPEKELLTHGYGKEVTVFGKLPRRAIQVPRYTGGTTTPDFIYMVEKEDDTSVYLIVETKAENKREDDERIVAIQEKFFSQLKEHGIVYQEATSANQVYNKLKKVGKINDD